MKAGAQGTAYNATVRTTQPESDEVVRLAAKVAKIEGHLAAAKAALAEARKRAKEN